MRSRGSPRVRRNYMFIGDFFRWISGTRKCRNLAELCAYIEPGDYDHLAHWISQRIWYKPDRKPRDSWEPADKVIKRGSCDCEEKAVIAAGVINTWPGCKAGTLAIIQPDAANNHAVCVFGDKDGPGYIDDSIVKRFPPGTELSEMVRGSWPAALDFYFCDIHGRRSGENSDPCRDTAA